MEFLFSGVKFDNMGLFFFQFHTPLFITHHIAHTKLWAEALQQPVQVGFYATHKILNSL